MSFSFEFSSLFVAAAFCASPALAQQGGVTHFCSPGANGATISASGSADLEVQGGSGDLVLQAQAVPNSTIGIFLQGNASMPALPLGQGFLCVGGTPHVWRLGSVSTGPTGTTVTLPIDYLNPPAPAAQIQFGDTWNFQLWFRDGASSDLTDALAIEFVPPVSMGSGVPLITATKTGYPLGFTFNGGALVIDDDATFQAFWAAHSAGFTPPPQPPQVDLNQSTLVAVFAGRRFSSGFSISVTDVALSVSAAQVTSLERMPGIGCGGIFYENSPWQLVALPKIGNATLSSWSAHRTTYTCP